VNIANTWAYIGVRDPGRFRWEQEGGLCLELCLQKETKKGRNGQLSPHGAFNLGPGLILWLN
jgi:hypothetical protein